MQINVENISTLERKLAVTISWEEIELKENKRINEIAKNAKIDGFRPGKVPMSLILARYKDAVHAEVIQDEIESSYKEALSQNKLQPVASPKIDVASSKIGEQLHYVAEFEVYPEIQLCNLENLSVVKEVAEITDQDVTDAIEMLRIRHAEWEDVDRAAEMGDQVRFEYSGQVQDEVFETKSERVILGKDVSLFPEFQKVLLKAKAGDEENVKIKYPSDSKCQDLAGKKGEFKIAVKTVLAPKLPNLDDNFFALFGVKDGGLDAFCKEIRDSMQRELDRILEGRVHKLIIKELVANNRIDVPRVLLQDEIEHIKQKEEQKKETEGENKPSPLFDIKARNKEVLLSADKIEDTAREKIISQLLLGEVIRVNDIKLDRSRLHSRFEAIASASNIETDKVVNWYAKNREQFSHLQLMLMEEQTMEFLTKKVTVKDKKISYKEAIETIAQM